VLLIVFSIYYVLGNEPLNNHLNTITMIIGADVDVFDETGVANQTLVVITSDQ